MNCTECGMTCPPILSQEQWLNYVIRDTLKICTVGIGISEECQYRRDIRFRYLFKPGKYGDQFWHPITYYGDEAFRPGQYEE